jgi:hypothetical protein
MTQQDTLVRLSKVAAKLNKASEEFNQHIVKMETLLQDCNVGQTVWLSARSKDGRIKWAIDPSAPQEVKTSGLRPNLGERTRTHWEIGFGRASTGNWRILAAEVLTDADTGELRSLDYGFVPEPKPLIECPRSVRIVAMRHLDELLERVIERAEDLVAEIEATVSLDVAKEVS